MIRGRLGRALGLAGLWLLAAGPAPGSVGSCDEQAVLVEAEAFCRDREGLICEREFQRGLRGLAVLQTRPERDACLQQVADRCQGALLPPGCAPTERDRDRCLGALASVERLDEPSREIPECQAEAFCGPDFSAEAGE